MNELSPQNTDAVRIDPRFARKTVITSFRNPKAMALSAREELALEVYLSTNGNLAEAARQVRAKFHTKTTPEGVAYWIEHKENMQEYLHERMKDEAYSKAWTKEKWDRIGTEKLLAPEKTDSVSFLFWKHIGISKGYMNENPMINQIVKIDFRQADGNK